jgi:adhesin transport system membrane fusion protein
LSAVRRQTLSSRVAALGASADQRRREMAEAQATVSSLSTSLGLARQRVSMLEPLAAKNIVPQTELLDARREVVTCRAALPGPASRPAAPPPPSARRKARRAKPISNSASRR